MPRRGPQRVSAASTTAPISGTWQPTTEDMMRMLRDKTLKHQGGGTFMASGARWHQHPDNGDILISDQELAQEFVEANENIFDVAQVNLDVLAALWQISSVDDVLQSPLFVDTAKEAAQRSAKAARDFNMMRMFVTQGICRPLILRRSNESTHGQHAEHPFAAAAVQTQYLVFQVMPPRDGRQTVQFVLGLHDRSLDGADGLGLPMISALAAPFPAAPPTSVERVGTAQPSAAAPAGSTTARTCSGCGCACERSEFSKTQWKKGAGSSRCSKCTDGKASLPQLPRVDAIVGGLVQDGEIYSTIDEDHFKTTSPEEGLQIESLDERSFPAAASAMSDGQHRRPSRAPRTLEGEGERGSSVGRGSAAAGTGQKRGVLIIEGFGLTVDPWMSDALLGVDKPPSPNYICVGEREANAQAREAWRRSGFGTPERCMLIDRHGNADLCAIARCVELVSRGSVGAVVVSDLGNDEIFSDFESYLGAALQAFVRGGGTLAILTSEGGLLVRSGMLQRLFGVTWASARYYRTTWTPASDNLPAVEAVTPPHLRAGFSLKASSIRKVPPTERLFGTAEGSRTQSRVPMMAGRPVGQRTEPGSVLAGAEGTDYDVAVAAHPCGAGRVVYFGDVNCELPTIELLVSYLSATVAAQPSPLSDGATASATRQASKAVAPLRSLAADNAVAAGASAEAVAAAGFPDAVTEAVVDAERRRFKAGAHVRLVGLAKKPELNGVCGHVLQLDEASGRFCVERLVSGPGEAHAIRVKPANLEGLPDWSPVISEVQKLVDDAARRGDGSRVSLPSGTYGTEAKDPGMGHGTREKPLMITSALVLMGKGTDATQLICEVTVGERVVGKLLHLANLSVRNATLTIQGKAIERVHLQKLRISLDGGEGRDALTLNETHSGKYHPEKVLLEECEVVGGGDGIMIGVHGCTLRKCRVLGAASRGIFANDSFIIEDSVVQGCGGYGMKTRGGCDRRGSNRIQAGPWDGHMAFGEGANPYGVPPPGSPLPFGFGGGFSGGFPGGFGGFGDDEEDDLDDDDDEVGQYGFTRAEEEELLAQGVRPWDEDAHDVLAALSGDYDD